MVTLGLCILECLVKVFQFFTLRNSPLCLIILANENKAHMLGKQFLSGYMQSMLDKTVASFASYRNKRISETALRNLSWSAWRLVLYHKLLF